MDLYTFCGYSLDNRRSLVQKSGRFLLLRELGIYLVCLYDMRKFYVEVWYNTQTQKVFRVLPFTSTDYLEPYLEKVNLIHLSNDQTD